MKFIEKHPEYTWEWNWISCNPNVTIKFIEAHPNFNLFEGRNKQAVNQHRQVLEKFGRYPQRNAEFGRQNTISEQAWLEDKENLPMWAGGKLPFNKKIK